MTTRAFQGWETGGTDRQWRVLPALPHRVNKEATLEA